MPVPYVKHRDASPPSANDRGDIIWPSQYGNIIYSHVSMQRHISMQELVHASSTCHSTWKLIYAIYSTCP